MTAYPYSHADPQLVKSVKLASRFLTDREADLPDYLQRCVPLTADEQHFADQDEEPNLRHALLRALHPTGYRDLRAFRKGEPPKTFSFAVSNLAGVDEFADRNHDRDVFFGVAPRIDDKGRDTSACHNLHALFTDQDYKDSSETEARARLAAFPLVPSAIIASGGGLQSYWFLSEPLDIAQAKALLRALAIALDADLNAAEPARILRMPGTRNYKYSPPRPVVVEAFSEQRRYALSDVRAVLPTLDTSPATTATAPASPPLPSSIPFGQQHMALFREGCRLRRIGWEAVEIADALWSLHLHRSEGDTVKHERADIDKLAHDICTRYEPAADTFPLSEAGDAEFFAACYAASVRYDHRQSRWLILDDHSGIWLPDRTGRLTGLALDAVRMRQRLALKIADSDKRQKALAWTSKSESRARLTNLQMLAQDLAPISDAGDDWDSIPHLLGTPDGVVDLRTRELRRALPEERITMRTSARYGRELGKHSARESGQIPRPEETWTKRDKPALRIIDVDLAARVDARREHWRGRVVAAKAKGRAPQNAGGKYLLSGGLLVCPTCGGHFEAFKSPWTAVYVCATRRRKPGVCTNTLALPIAATDDAVLDLVEGEALGGRFIDELLSMVDTAPDPTAHLVAERARLQEQITNLVESVAKGMPVDTIAPVVKQYQAEVAKLDVQLRTPKPAPPNIENLRDALEQRATEWRATLRTEPTVARRLLRRLVGPLTLWDASEADVQWEAALIWNDLSSQLDLRTISKAASKAVEAAIATVDHSDIRGSVPHNRDPSGATSD